MKVVLMQDIPKLGMKFQVVEVSDGYARNYLIPRRLAQPVTPALLKEIEKRRQQEQQKERKALERSQELAQKLANIVVEIPAPAGEGGRLYHAVSAHEIALHLKQQHGIEIDRDQVLLEEPLRSLGVHTVPIRLHRQVRTNLKVNITAAPA
ncbi:MAG: 50S ribosomal protein L9 [Candidatus Fervidibacter sp.]|uniref:50S ribosomal protein L9 n=1 Tax=Candidatus Fervidibacter sp. TaxID=3100871 RepID=UPI00404B21AD